MGVSHEIYAKITIDISIKFYVCHAMMANNLAIIAFRVFVFYVFSHFCRCCTVGLSLLVVRPRKKMFSMRQFCVRLKKRRFDEKRATKSRSAGTHAVAQTTK